MEVQIRKPLSHWQPRRISHAPRINKFNRKPSWFKTGSKIDSATLSTTHRVASIHSFTICLSSSCMRLTGLMREARESRRLRYNSLDHFGNFRNQAEDCELITVMNWTTVLTYSGWSTGGGKNWRILSSLIWSHGARMPLYIAHEEPSPTENLKKNHLPVSI